MVAYTNSCQSVQRQTVEAAATEGHVVYLVRTARKAFTQTLNYITNSNMKNGHRNQGAILLWDCGKLYFVEAKIGHNEKVWGHRQ